MEDNQNDTQNETDRLIAERFATLRVDGEWQPNLHRGLARLREQHLARSGRRRRWALIGSGALVACLPLMAFPVTRAFAERCVSACVTETSAVREFLLRSAPAAAPSNTYVKPENRKMAPDFTLDDASGQPVRLSGSRGKVVLLNFWATWCAPCKREIPWFIEFQQSWKQRDFAVLGISMDEDGWASVKPYIDEIQVNYRVMIGNPEVAGLFGGLHSIPLSLVIDRSGRIAAIHAGLCRKDEYETDINAVLNER
jgi:peroxiredoxin